MMKKIYFILLSLLFPIVLFGQLNGLGTSESPYSGTMEEGGGVDQTWSSDTYINGDVTVDDEKLTIDPGVTIKFYAGTSLIINGTGIIDANGTSGNEVIFTEYTTDAGWGNIQYSSSSSSTIEYCKISKGTGNSGMGGGINISSDGLTVDHCEIFECSATYGGGIEINDCSPTIQNSIIHDNTGGGIEVYLKGATIQNCLIYGNSGSASAGIYVWEQRFYTVTITNCTILENNNTTSGEFGGIHIAGAPGTTAITNCILWNNIQGATTEQDYSDNGTISYSAVTQDGISGGLGMVNLHTTNDNAAGPNFTNPLSDDYSITALSPCVDVGTTGTSTDILGNPRVGDTDIGAYENQGFVWQGDDITNPTYWNDADNWNRGVIPTSGAVIAINGSLSDYPVVNTDATVEDITIASGASLTINENYYLTVNGTLTNSASNAGLVIKSSSSGDGELISSNAVSATVELYLTGGTGGSGPRFHYFVPPVTSMSFDNSNPTTAATDLGITGNFNGDLVVYDEDDAGTDKDAGWNYFDGYGTTTPFSSLTSAQGYNIYLTDDDNITFTGTLNATQHSFSSLSYTDLGWNLVGNPFPCNYDLDGISVLTGSGDDVNNTVYYNNDGGYTYWNVSTDAGSSGYSDIIPPMQGFFVLVTATGKSLSLPVASKTTSAADSRSKGETDAKDGVGDIGKIKLVLNNGIVPDETIVCLIDNATTGFDGDYDGYKLFGGGTTTPFIYTVLNDIKYAINSLQGPITEPISIPVVVDIKEQGDYKIDITEFENLDEYKVILKHGDVETTLSLDTSYSFTSEAGVFTDFEVIVTNSATGINYLNQGELKTWYSNNYLYINCPEEIVSNNGRLVIYNIEGKMVFSKNSISVIGGQTVQVPVSLGKGIYLTRLYSKNRSFVSKIVVL